MSISNVKYDVSSLNSKSNFHSYNSDGHKPNQNMNIFKKRMAESMSSSCKLEEEIYNSSSKQARVVLVQISVLLFATLLLLSGVYFYKQITSKPVFCSEGLESNCLPCPANSICSKGDFQCKAPLIRAGYECIEDREVIQKAYKHLNKIEKYIIDKSVDQYIEDRSVYFISITELDLLFKESEAVQEKMIDLLSSQKSSKLVSQFKDGVQHFTAKPPILGVFAIIQVFWQDNLYYLVAGFVGFLLVVAKMIRVRKERVLVEKAAQMFEMIRAQLKANVDDTPEHGVPEDNLKDEIMSALGSVSGKALWPLIESLRKKDKQVSKFEIHVAGRPLMLWQWADVRSLKQSS